MSRTKPGLVIPLLLLASILFALPAYAQKEADKWFFGIRLGMDFSSGSPVPLQGSDMVTDEGCATMSDKNGNLLFYTDGEDVWNRNHQIMPNGTGLKGGYTSTQSAIAFPFPDPNNDSLYYIFTVGQEDHPNDGLCYSVVNMKRNNGLGDVVTKNVSLLLPAYEKLTAVKQKNCPNYWVLAHKWNSDEYCAFLVSASGISAPVISSTGNVTGGSPRSSKGQLKFSPDGTKVAAAMGITFDYVELSDFDPTTGILSNTIKLFPNPPFQEPFSIGAYGVEFSPNSKYLYVSATYGFSPSMKPSLYQYDVTAGNAAAIEASKVLLDDQIYCYGMQLGPDKKIYVAQFNYISVINNPDVAGVGCNYAQKTVLPGASINWLLDFPAFVQSIFKDPIIATGNCEFQNIQFGIENAVGISHVEWDFGDPASGTDNKSTALAPLHIYSQEGDYTARLVIFGLMGCEPDTFYKLIHAGPFKVFLGNDTTICAGDSLTLQPAIPNSTTLWSDGSTGNSLKVKQPGKYWVRVIRGVCQATDTIVVSDRPVPVFTLGKDTTICNNQPLTLAATPTGGAGYEWSTGATSTDLPVIAAGDYWLKITDNYGCYSRDTIKVTFKSLPQFSLGNDTSVCTGETVQLATTINSATFNWSTGATAAGISAQSTGYYWLDVTKDNCTYRDSIHLTFKPLPQVYLGKDTTLCEGAQLTLDAGNAGSTYNWNAGNTSQTVTVHTDGIYRVEVTTDGCKSRDTIAVSYTLRPRFTLGPDQVLCRGIDMILDPAIMANQYVWQDGSTTATYKVKEPGLHHVAISNECGTTRDSVLVTRGICQVTIPNAFTPNNDRNNNVFRITGVEVVTEFQLEIYNRWGQKVFATTDKNAAWNGTINGTPAAEGLYIYILRYKTIDNPTTFTQLKGSVLLLR